MRPADTRLQSIGATFAVQYYTALVQSPASLAAFYTPNANAEHNFQKATGTAEIQALLTSLAATAAATEVKLEDVSTTRTTSGGIKVTITGHLVHQDKSEQAFTHELQMRELDSNVFGVTSDKLTYAAATAAAGGQVAWAAAETPEVKPAEAPAVEEKKEEKKASRKATPAPAPATPTPTPTPTPAAAATPTPQPAAEPAKKPTSFAEALKMKKMAEGAAFSNKAVRVVASDKTEKAEKADNEKGEGKKHAGKKEEKPAAAAAAAEGTAAPAVVYYDIILKDLAVSVTEEEVRAMVTPVAAVKLVNVVKSEKRRRHKAGEEKEEEAAAAAAVTCFAFVQLDRPADAAPTHVADVLAKLAEHNKEVRAEEVREKKHKTTHAPRPSGAAGQRKPADGAHPRKRAEHGAGNKAKAAAAATKAPQKE